MLTVRAIKCSSCGDVIYSRAHHDFHSCTCGAINVDGGFEYMRYSWDNKVSQPIPFTLEVDATKKELYDDWNKHIDSYGVIHSYESSSGM